MNFSRFLAAERPVFVVMLLALVPWVGVALFTGGTRVAFHTGGYAFLVFVVGYAMVSAVLPTGLRSQVIVLAPSAGILLLSALTAFLLRLDLPLIWASAVWIGLTATGVLGLWWDRGLLQKATVAYGGGLVILSVVICAVYFIPGALNDAVLRSDGGFNWMYFDMPFFHSMAGNIKYCDGPPTIPGTFTAQLCYHFGPYAPAAALSRWTGINVGDALVRVTRGVEQWALVFSCCGLGTLLSLKASGGKFGGIMSVVGLFFYGSLSVLFGDSYNGLTHHVTRAILFNIPGLDVPADGGPFDHLVSGHSCLHGLSAIAVVMGFCLCQSELGTSLKGRALTLLALPALVVPVNSVAALYCIGIVATLLCWGHLRELRSWLAMVIVLALFLGAWKLMGFGHASEAAQTTVNFSPTGLWWTLAVWFIVGLGFRIVGFGWISLPFRDPVSVLVLATVIGLLSFFILLQLHGNEHYGLYYLQAMFSIFAFSRLTPGFWHGVERLKWVSEWIRLAKKGMLLVTASGVLIFIITHATHGHTGIIFFRFKIFLACLVLVALVGVSTLVKRSRRFSNVIAPAIMSMLLVGLLAWVPIWLLFGIRVENRDMTLTAGEVRGLKRLGELAAPSERFATNKHKVDGLVDGAERSYGYGALAERAVLLEGYRVGGEEALPNFETLLNDNDLLFTTTNSSRLHDIANIYHVKWLVAQPGTDIALPRPLPAWLDKEANCGDLNIYRID